jgi:ABC-type Fe3+ transport system substrate-binding protein
VAARTYTVTYLLTDLLKRIDDSRQQMADPAYRARLQCVGLSARDPQQNDEPADIAVSVEKLQARLRVLSGEASR